MENRVQNFTLIFLFILCGCRDKIEEKSIITLENVFQNPPLTIASVTKSYQSEISVGALIDMDESILCMSSKINEQSNTYFIQPDKVDLKDLTFKYHEASVVDMKTALLIRDLASGKETLFYLPGRFPIDSMTLKPDAIIPVLGISSYHSKLEKISSRWTEIVCKCVDKSSGPVIFKGRTINECDSGGEDRNECSLTTEGSIMNCQTQCRGGAIACCWFEF